jgi:pyrimidine-nucleoside phosphorylase
MVLLGGGADDYDSAYTLVKSKLENGEAFEKFKEFVTAQGGNVEVIEDPSKLPQASHVVEVKAEKAGYLESIQSDEVGISAMMLGAGRAKKEDTLDMSAGIVLNKKVGDKVDAGEVIATLYTCDEKKIADAQERFLKALTFTTHEIEPRKLIKAIVTKDGVQKF